MAELKFSYSKALGHAWKMTWKYWKIILGISLVYVLFYTLSGVLDHYAGSTHMDKSHVKVVLKDDPEQISSFLEALQAQGVIDKFGVSRKSLAS